MDSVGFFQRVEKEKIGSPHFFRVEGFIFFTEPLTFCAAPLLQFISDWNGIFSDMLYFGLARGHFFGCYGTWRVLLKMVHIVSVDQSPDSPLNVIV